MSNENKNPLQGLSDIKTLRQRGREHVENGAVTPSYAADREVVLRLLNEALATELVCTLRYLRHYFTADGVHAESIKQEFLAHAQEEEQHAHQLARKDGTPVSNDDIRLDIQREYLDKTLTM